MPWNCCGLFHDEADPIQSKIQFEKHQRKEHNSFTCPRCGNILMGIPGYVSHLEGHIEAMAAHLEGRQ